MKKIEIKSRYGDVLYVAKGAADVREAVEMAERDKADLRFANLRFADLGFANLGSANLGSANLGSADLGSADLRSADLRFANLGFADLRFAKGLRPERSNDLLLLREQVGKIRAYKLVTKDLMSPIQSDNRIKYEIGSTVSAKANMDESEDCGAGINLATLPWCLNEHRDGYRILVCEFAAKDIAAIPNADGKFRVHKAKVVKELDLTEMFEAEAKEREEFEKQWAERKAKS